MAKPAELDLDARRLTYVAHLIEVAAAVMVLVWCICFRGGLAFASDTNKSLIFNIHPVLMLIGFIILGSEAIMSYKALPFTKKTNKLIHLVCHGLAFVIGIIGIYAAFKYHNESGIANLYSLHSWLGLGTISLYAIQWIYGFVTFFYPGREAAARRGYLPWHVLFGIMVYILAIATAELGFLEKLTFLENSGLVKYGTEALLVNFNALAVILIAVCVLLSSVSTAHSAACNPPPHGYAEIPTKFSA